LSWFRSNSNKQPSSEEITGGEKSDDISAPQALANAIGFERKGKFKKASNMNYGLAFSLRVEEEMARLMEGEAAQRGCTVDDLSVEDDERLYQLALENCLVADEGKTCMCHWNISQTALRCVSFKWSGWSH
jgi:hypothetical protein